MKTKIKIIFILLVFLGCFIAINSVYAIDDYSDDDNGHIEEMKLLKTKTEHTGYIKKQGIYYKQYQKVNYYKMYFDGEEDGIGKGYSAPFYKKAKKGDILKKSTPKYWKTVNSKGKTYKYYKYRQTVALSSNKIKTKIATSKKIIGYYKTYEMPSLGVNKIKKTSFRGNTIVYGRWGYEWGVSDLTGDVEKVKAKGAKVTFHDYKYWKFSKKPRTFTIYMWKFIDDTYTYSFDEYE